MKSNGLSAVKDICAGLSVVLFLGGLITLMTIVG